VVQIAASPERGESRVSALTLCFVTRSVGEISETWMWRQIMGFARVRTHVLTWRYIHRDLFPVGDVPVDILPEAGCWPEETSKLMRRVHRFRNLASRNFFATTRGEYAAIGKMVSEIHPDVMLCQYGTMGLRMLPIARRLAIPLAVHFHGSDLAGGLANRWYRWSIERAIHQFRAIIVVNTKQRDWLVQRGVSPETVHVIPCGVPTDESVPPLPRERNGSSPQFMVVSRLVKLKGIDITIRAFASVVSEIPEARLVIAGEGPEREDLEALVRDLGLTAHVRFAGWLSQMEIRRELERSDVFVQHSLVPEGWPVSVAEASAMGLPVVVTGCGGLAEQVVDNVTGLIVPMRDVGRMQESMLRLTLDPDLRTRMGTAGRARMIQEFDVKRQIAKLEDVLIGCARAS
jgi:colanic acid/amylovoran biosynthesis glycosyltransferase